MLSTKAKINSFRIQILYYTFISDLLEVSYIFLKKKKYKYKPKDYFLKKKYFLTYIHICSWSSCFFKKLEGTAVFGVLSC